MSTSSDPDVEGVSEAAHGPKGVQVSGAVLRSDAVPAPAAVPVSEAVPAPAAVPVSEAAESSPVLRDAIVRLSFEVIGRLGRMAAEADMSLTQLRMLGILRDRRLRMSELAAFLGTDRSSVSGLIARAERRDLVLREPAADDRRSYTVTLTPAGLRFAARFATTMDEELAPFLAPLDAAESASLTTLLERIVETVDP